MTDGVYAFLAVLNNPAVRKLIYSSNKFCHRCGESHLEAALDDYIGKNNHGRCVKGKLI